MNPIAILTMKLERKRAQLMDYILGLIDQEGPISQHARSIAEGRVSQIDQMLKWVEELQPHMAGQQK